MASLIIGFVLAHWEDLLIAFGVGVILLLLDFFVLRRRHAENEISDSFDSTDRLISYVLCFGFVTTIFIWISGHNLEYILYLSGVYLVMLIYLFDHRFKKMQISMMTKGVLMSNKKSVSSKPKTPTNNHKLNKK